MVLFYAVGKAVREGSLLGGRWQELQPPVGVVNALLDDNWCRGWVVEVLSLLRERYGLASPVA